jgi:hypothetical protein
VVNVALLDQHPIEQRGIEQRELLIFLLDDLGQALIDAAGAAFVDPDFGFQAVKAGSPIASEPGFEGFPVVLFATVAWHVKDFLRHLFEVAGLSVAAIMQDGSDDAIAK